MECIPSELSHNLFQTQDNKSYETIEDFSFHELLDASRKYEEYFGLKNHISGDTLEICKNPSILRIVAELYAGREVPSQLNSTDIFRKYLEDLFQKSSNNSTRLKDHLIQVAKYVVETLSDEVFEADILSKDHTSHEFLTDYGVLVSRQDSEGRALIRFSLEFLKLHLWQANVIA